MAVNRSIEASPAAFDIDIDLVDPPGTVAQAQMWALALLQRTGISLDPYVDGPLLARCVAVL
jgi:hypothetical protein